MVFKRRAEFGCGDTMIYTIENQKKLLADACQCQMLPDRNEDKLLVFQACRILMPAGARQCQIWPTPNRFLPDRPQWADLAMSGVHLLGTVWHPEAA
jgi:hypothetical protein